MQTGRQRESETDRKTGRQIDRNRNREREGETDRQAKKQR